MPPLITSSVTPEPEREERQAKRLKLNEKYEYVNGPPTPRKSGKGYGFVVAAVERKGAVVRDKATKVRRLTSDEEDEEKDSDDEVLPVLNQKLAKKGDTSTANGGDPSTKGEGGSSKRDESALVKTSGRTRVVIDDDDSEDEDYKEDQEDDDEELLGPILESSETKNADFKKAATSSAPRPSASKPATIRSPPSPITTSKKSNATRKSSTPTAADVIRRSPIRKLTYSEVVASRAYAAAKDLSSRFDARSGRLLMVTLDNIAWKAPLDRHEVENRETNIKAMVKSLTNPNIKASWKEYPDIVRSTALRLLQRWKDGVYDANPWNRWTTVRPQESHRGHMGFIVGEVFMNRDEMRRAGIHKAQIAGIVGRVGEGAHSIVVSKSDYNDVDNGETLWYSGTYSGEDEEMKRATSLLEECLKYGQPYKIRVLRTSRCDYRHAPKHGVRYDGLYTIVARKALPGQKGNFAYKLVRCEDQDPIVHTPGEMESRLIETEQWKRERARKGRK